MAPQQKRSGKTKVDSKVKVPMVAGQGDQKEFDTRQKKTFCEIVAEARNYIVSREDLAKPNHLEAFQRRIFAERVKQEEAKTAEIAKQEAAKTEKVRMELKMAEQEHYLKNMEVKAKDLIEKHLPLLIVFNHHISSRKPYFRSNLIFLDP